MTRISYVVLIKGTFTTSFKEKMICLGPPAVVSHQFNSMVFQDFNSIEILNEEVVLNSPV